MEDLNIEVYIISEQPDNLKIKDKKVVDIIDEFNTKHKKTTIMVTSSHAPYYRVENIKFMSSKEEIEFHNKAIFCIINTPTLIRYQQEVFIVRCHHFLFNELVNRFCILNINQLPKKYGTNCKKRMESIQKIILRCPIILCESLIPELNNFIAVHHLKNTPISNSYLY